MCDGNCDLYADAYGDAHRYANTNSNSNYNAYANSNSDSNTNSYSYSYAQTDASTAGSPNTRTMPVRGSDFRGHQSFLDASKTTRSTFDANAKGGSASPEDDNRAIRRRRKLNRNGHCR